MTANTFGVAKAIEAVIFGNDLAKKEKAAKAFFQYLSENPAALTPVLPRILCAVVVDPGAGPVMEIANALLPPELRSGSEIRACDHFSDVVVFMQQTLPALLIIHSNLLIEISIEAIGLLVAISPATRYLVITGWSEIDFFRTIAKALRIQIHVLQTPFQPDEFVAAVRAIGLSHE
jgi:hypothetical protein